MDLQVSIYISPSTLDRPQEDQCHHRPKISVAEAAIEAPEVDNDQNATRTLPSDIEGRRKFYPLCPYSLRAKETN